jgi:hypothetical protein
MRGSFIPSQSINLLFRYSCFLALAFLFRESLNSGSFLWLPRVGFLGGAPVAAFKSLPQKMQNGRFHPGRGLNISDSDDKQISATLVWPVNTKRQEHQQERLLPEWQPITHTPQQVQKD